jgi:flagellar assembly protein FliH
MADQVHAKILRKGQYTLDESKFVVQAPRVFRKTKEQEVDESKKRIDDLHEEIRQLESELNAKLEKSEKEAEEIIEKADSESERIVKEAEKSAFERVKKSIDEKNVSIQEKQEEVDSIIADSKKAAAEIINDANIEAEKIKEAAKKDGFDIGKDEGFEVGKAEIVSMTDRLKSIIKTTLEEREKILIHSERQIISLILSMVKKIVKKLTLEEETVVINNTKEALSIIRGAMKVYIHVNPEDYMFTVKHKDELIKLIEGMPEVKFFEDPTVDKGGVFIETDVGEIDAKIASQLEEIEDKIRFYVPMKVKARMEDREEKIEINTNESLNIEPIIIDQ